MLRACMQKEGERQGTLKRMEEEIPELFEKHHPTPLLFLCNMASHLSHDFWYQLVDIFLPTGSSKDRRRTHRIMQRNGNSFSAIVTLLGYHSNSLTLTYLCQHKGLDINQQGHGHSTPLLHLVKKEHHQGEDMITCLVRLGVNTQATVQRKVNGKKKSKSVEYYLRKNYVKNYWMYAEYGDDNSKDSLLFYTSLIRQIKLASKYTKRWHQALHRRKSREYLAVISTNPDFGHITLTECIEHFPGNTRALIQERLEELITCTKTNGILIHKRGRRLVRKLSKMSLETL
jgi:hypothetical protein